MKLILSTMTSGSSEHCSATVEQILLGGINPLMYWCPATGTDI
jgi:hypothetical protein